MVTADMTPAGTRAGRPGLGAAYWRVWLANTIMSTGDGMFVTAMPLLAVALTRDPRLVSLVTAAQFLPWLLLSLHAGVLADRHDRATLMWRAQAVQAVIVVLVTILVVLHAISVAALIGAGFCIGAAQVVFSNAAQAILPRLVPAGQLAKANGRLQVSLTVGETFAGPPLGSVLFAMLRALPFGLGAGAFAGSALLLSGLPRGERPAASPVPMRGGIAEGLRYLTGHRLLRTLALLLGVSNFSWQMCQAVLVLFATGPLHAGARGYGLLFTASAVGAILGGFVNPVITRKIGMLPSLVLAMAALAAATAGVGLAPNAIVAGLIMVCEGFLVTMWNVVTVSLRQEIVPEQLLGRVNSVYRLIGWGLIPIGAAAGGLIARTAGLRAPFLVAAATCAVALAVSLPALSRATRRTHLIGRC